MSKGPIFRIGIRLMRFVVQVLQPAGWASVAAFRHEADAKRFALSLPDIPAYSNLEFRIILEDE